VRFIADGMLGKLARWLRMLGQDVEYFNRLEDSELMSKAKEEHRVLLTRDLELYQRASAKNIEAFYVEGKTEAEKLAELAQRFDFPLQIDLKLSRCPKCNTQITPVPKEKLEGKVKEKTFRYYNEFWECPNCGSVYWQGAHWGRIRATLKEAEENLEKTQGA
jgi:uncharacterized protein with PIN domain